VVRGASTWKPPKELGRRISALLKAAQDRPQGSWLGIGGLRLGVVAAQRGRTVFMVGRGPGGVGSRLGAGLRASGWEGLEEGPGEPVPLLV